MSGDAASLPCPVCSHTGNFDSVKSLRDKLIFISTNKIPCPVCQEEVCGLDKLTIHLFSHVKISTKVVPQQNENKDTKCKTKSETQPEVKTQPKKPRPSSSGAKNKVSVPSPGASMPVKFVKIYPKLPVISLNTVPVIDILQGNSVEENQVTNSIYVPAVKTEASVIQTNNACNVCGVQFIDANILRMHKCLIHNIDENSNQCFTRYHCHLCTKNFKMRGSLMVHLRVAHYGFSSENNASNNSTDTGSEVKHVDTQSGDSDKPIAIERSDNKQWQCDVCRKCFTTKYFLKKHKRLHTGETPYACTQCNKTFTFQQSYHKHLLYHNDEKPHTCSYCGRSFKELSTLHNHQRIHTGEKPFSCETCGKCFRQRVSYLVHRRIHTGVMPYKCTACEKSFRYKVSQRTHKCQSQPPGTVIRQAGDLVEKLMKKHSDNETIQGQCQEISKKDKHKNETLPKTNTDMLLNYSQISATNAELVLRGAKLSLEDMESENFTLLTDNSEKDQEQQTSCYSVKSQSYEENKNSNLFDSFNDLMQPIPMADKSMPSPSENFKNLCLSNEDDYIGILHEGVQESKDFDVCKEFDAFL